MKLSAPSAGLRPARPPRAAREPGTARRLPASLRTWWRRPAAVALLTLAATYWLVEVRGWRRWAAPFAVLGVNALLVYFLSSLVALLMSIIRVGADGRSVKTALFERLFAPMATPANASLAFAAVYVVAWWAILWVLYRWNIRVRV